MASVMSKADTRRMLGKLEEAYPVAECELIYSNQVELLMATMLSAQTTADRVNRLTARLFKKYRTLEDYAAADEAELHEDIQELGLFPEKASHLISLAQVLLKRYKGEIPRTHEELMQLPGIGRKTASLILANVHGIPALAVDVHVQRVANRIGAVNSMNAEITEKQLCQKIPQRLWIKTHFMMNHLGRTICTPKNPKCHQCPVAEFCRFRPLLENEAERMLRAKVLIGPVDQPKVRRRQPGGSP
ncbi:MAG: endonuclease III [Alicyclobacillus sp.]|nr:endonuclease III [Alicyclobacillus sp.]